MTGVSRMKRLLGVIVGILLIYYFCSNHSIYAGTKGPDIAHNIQPANNSSMDIFGIKKLYDSKLGGFEWYMNMSNPQADPYLYNYHKMIKNPDGSYNIGNVSRLSVYSKDGIGYVEGSMDTYNFTKLSLKGYWYKPSDWKNAEITGEYHYRGGNGQGITQYARSEDHSRCIVDVEDQVIRTKYTSMEQAISIKSKPIHSLGSLLILNTAMET